MDKNTVLRYIDEWANYYLRILGEADNLELVEKDTYTILRPKSREWSSVFDIRLEHLKEKDLINTVNEIKSMKTHVWWNQYSDRINSIVFPEGRREPTPDDDEVFAVMTFADAPEYQNGIITVKQAETPDDFRTFHNICFDKTLNPDNLLTLHRKDMIRCYIGYENKMPVSVTAVLKNGRIYSLELASTLSEQRRKGFAAAVCQAAINEAFNEGAEVVTIRAGGGSSASNDSKYLGRKLGFRYI